MAKRTSGSTKRQPMGEDHKAALAEGREQGRAIRHYLEALEVHKPRRGRKRSVDSIEQRLADIDYVVQQDETDPLQRVQLAQERLNLQRQLDAQSNGFDLEALEEDFVAVAGSYSERKGLTYAAWRSIGVPPSVLRNAGISR